jgi:hypothetical protein
VERAYKAAAPLVLELADLAIVRDTIREAMSEERYRRLPRQTAAEVRLIVEERDMVYFVSLLEYERTTCRPRKERQARAHAIASLARLRGKDYRTVERWLQRAQPRARAWCRRHPETKGDSYEITHSRAVRVAFLRVFERDAAGNEVWPLRGA